MEQLPIRVHPKDNVNGMNQHAHEALRFIQHKYIGKESGANLIKGRESN